MLNIKTRGDRTEQVLYCNYFTTKMNNDETKRKNKCRRARDTYFISFDQQCNYYSIIVDHSVLNLHVFFHLRSVLIINSNQMFNVSFTLSSNEMVCIKTILITRWGILNNPFRSVQHHRISSSRPVQNKRLLLKLI